MSRKEPKPSEPGAIILKDLLREKYPETYEWLYGKRRRHSGSKKKPS